jgi:2-polyprenyl-3-methyl-5-hydroxy-6-metoxy-1,4-benzoquinol methylase
LSIGNHTQELNAGQRFAFGKNWRRFLAVLNDERIATAEKSLTEMLEIDTLQGKSFLDVGSGSGLFSLAARRLGARVHSFDYDPQSVACARQLKDKYYPNDSHWIIEEGSVLDEQYLKSLGQFDIVYAWGCLHHTGEMWRALNNVKMLVKNGGKLFIAIYNDQGFKSKLWRKVKKIYCSSTSGKIFTVSVYFTGKIIVRSVVSLIKSKNPLSWYFEYNQQRGMSIVHDWLDWLGGYPFEVAKPEEIFNFYKQDNFLLEKMTTTNSEGNNQFVFYKHLP